MRLNGSCGWPTTGLRLLDPVERGPLDDDPAAEVGVVGGEPRGRDGVVTDDQVVGLPGAVVPLEVKGAEHRGEPVGHLGPGRGTSVAARSSGGTAYIGTTPARLPDQRGVAWCRAPAHPRSEARTRRVTGSKRSSP